MAVEHVLPVKRLPQSLTGLCPGGLYLLMHEEEAPPWRLTDPMLLKAAEQKLAVWITGIDPELLWTSERLTAPRLKDAAVDGTLRMFRGLFPQDAISMDALLKELDYFEVAQQSLIVLDGADRIIQAEASAARTEALAPLRRWADHQSCTIVLCYRQKHLTQDLAKCSGNSRLSGIAQLTQHGNVLNMDIAYWFGADGVVSGQKFRLVVDKDQQLSVEEEAIKSVVHHVKEADEDEVVITMTALLNHPMPPGWRMVAGNESYISEQAGHVACTFILHFDRDTSLTKLTEIVFNLRKRFGLRIRIVVRQINAYLRYNQARLLLLAGANLVIPPLMGFSQVRGFLDALEGQVYSRPLLDNLKDLQVLAEPVPHRGYVTPKQFVEGVSKVLKQHEVLVVDNALVQLLVFPGLTFQNILQSLSLSRSGDLCTRHNEYVYLFFAGCREADVSTALEHAFRAPIGDLFEGEVRYLSTQSIEEVLDNLDTDGNVVIFRKPDPREQEASKPQQNVEQQGVQRAPVVAIRRPLTLRQTATESHDG